MALLERNPDALLLYTPVGMGSTRLQDWHDGFYPRQVEGRLAADESVRRHFAPVAWLSLGTQGAGYVLLWRTDDPSDR
jgi:hypothetical protein